MIHFRRVGLLVIMAAVAALVAAPLSAQSQRQVADSMRQRGYTVVNPRSDGGRPTWDVSHDEGVPFELTMVGGFSEARAEALRSIRERVFGLSGLDVRRARVVFENDRATAVVIPRRYVVGGRDYTGYMPSGMQFTFDNALAYDFRMLADDLALRINGQFLTERQFVERMVRAIDNPAGYIESSDPQFLARRLDEQQTLLDQTRQSNLVQGASIERLEVMDRRILEMLDEYAETGEAAVDELIREGERLYRALRDELRREISRMDNVIETAHRDFEEQLAELNAQQDGLAAITRELSEHLETVRRGSVAMAGRTLFGSLRDVDAGAVAGIVALRAADPELDADDARDRVNETLPEDAEPLHKRHVQAIYAIYFNDYR